MNPYPQGRPRVSLDTMPSGTTADSLGSSSGRDRDSPQTLDPAGERGVHRRDPGALGLSHAMPGAPRDAHREADTEHRSRIGRDHASITLRPRLRPVLPIGRERLRPPPPGQRHLRRHRVEPSSSAMPQREPIGMPLPDNPLDLEQSPSHKHPIPPLPRAREQDDDRRREPSRRSTHSHADGPSRRTRTAPTTAKNSSSAAESKPHTTRTHCHHLTQTSRRPQS